MLNQFPNTKLIIGQPPSWLEAAGGQSGQLVRDSLRRQQAVEHPVQGRQRKAELVESAANDLEEGAPAAGPDRSRHAAAVSPVQRTSIEITYRAQEAPSCAPGA